MSADTLPNGTHASYMGGDAAQASSLKRTESASSITFERSPNGRPLLRSRSGSSIPIGSSNLTRSSLRRCDSQESSPSRSRASSFRSRRSGSFNMRSSVDRLHSNPVRYTPEQTKLEVNDRVIVDGVHSAVLRYYGTVQFASGPWAGIEYDDAVGKHDGKIQGRRYFTARPGHGAFVKRAQLAKEPTVEDAPLPEAFLRLRSRVAELESLVQRKEQELAESGQVLELTKDELTKEIVEMKYLLDKERDKQSDADAAIQRLVKDLDHREAELLSTQRDADNAHQKVQELEEEVGKQKEVISSNQAEMRQLNTLLRRADEELERSRADADKSKAQLDEQHRQAQAEADNLRKTVDSLEQQLQSLTLDLQYAKQEAASSPTSPARSSRALASEDEAESASSESKLLKDTMAKFEELRTKFDHEVSENGSLSQQLSQAQSKILELTSSLETLTHENERAVNELEERRKQCRQLERQKEDLETDLGSSQRKADLLQSQLDSLKSQNENTERRLAAVSAERDRLRLSGRTSEDNETPQLRAAAEKARQDASDMRSKLLIAEDRISRLESQLSYRNSQPSSDSAELSQLKVTVETQKLQIESLQKQAERSRQNAEEAERARDQERRRAEAEKDRAERLASEDTSRSSELQRQVDTLHAELKPTKEEKEALMTQLGKLRSSLAQSKLMNKKLADQLRVLVAGGDEDE